MHDVFSEMQLNGAQAEQRIFLKALVGSVSEHGGARPSESHMIYDAMRRSGIQLKVRFAPTCQQSRPTAQPMADFSELG